MELLDRKKKKGFQQLDLEPTKCDFNYVTELNNNAIYSTKSIFNNKVRGNLKFPDEIIPSQRISFDLLNLINWMGRYPRIDLAGTKL